MRFFGLDYSKKILHIAVATIPVKLEYEKKASIHGLVYRPDAVYNKVNTNSERLYEELFQPGQIYQTVAVETEMGPGELGLLLEKKFSINFGLWVGGIAGHFTADSAHVTRMLDDLVANPKRYLASKEKKIYA